MKQRNPKARCGNCPYWMAKKVYDKEDDEWYDSDEGMCFRYAPKSTQIHHDIDDVPWFGKQNTSIPPFRIDNEWCGEHPDFFLE